MIVTNPKVDLTLALADQPTPFLDPQSGQAASSPLPNYDDHLTMLVQWFEEAEDATRRARELSERDRDYHDNFDDSQWTSGDKATLNQRLQPIVTSNYIKRKVSTLCGGERRMRSDPKAFPRNPQDEQTAGAATDVLRYISDENKFNTIRSRVYENMLVEGYGGVDVVVEQLPDGDNRVVFKPVAWERLVYDPHSTMNDFSDATYKGIVIWKDAKKDQQDVLGETIRNSGSETFDDKPRSSWVDSKRKRVRVVQMHYLWDADDGQGEQWWVATYTKAGFVEQPVVSPYVDKYGRSVCSLIMRAAYVDRENNRFGAVRDWVSTQEEINKRRSKMLHLLSVRQTFGNKTAIQDVGKAKSELAKPNGHIEINGGAVFGQDFGMIPTGDMVNGHADLLQLAINEMQASGPNAAMAGKAPGQQSGRALEAQMQAGSVEMEPLADQLRQWTREVYEASWLRARQFWTSEKWVRVTDDDRKVKFVGLNKQVTVQDKLAQMGDEMRAQWLLQRQIQPNDPRLMEVVEVENDISGLDVDIVVEEGPDISTLQSEQFEIVSELARSGVPMKSGKPIPLESLIELSSLRNKDKFLKSLTGEDGQENPELQAAQEQMQQMGQQMEAMGAEINSLKTDQSIKQGELQIKGGDLQLKARELETRAVEAQGVDQSAMIQAAKEIVIAQLQAMAAASSQPAAPDAEPEPQPDVGAMMADAMMMLTQTMATVLAPKPPMTIVHDRDEDGRIAMSREVPQELVNNAPRLPEQSLDRDPPFIF